MIRAPVTLGISSECGTCSEERTQKNQQLSVTKEVAGSFSETREKVVHMFVQITVKPRYHIHVQELVKEPATSSPLTSVTKRDKIPRVHIHAWGWQLAREEVRSVEMAYSSSIGRRG